MFTDIQNVYLYIFKCLPIWLVFTDMENGKMFTNTQNVYRYTKCLPIHKMFTDIENMQMFTTIQNVYRYTKCLLIHKMFTAMEKCLPIYKMFTDMQNVYRYTKIPPKIWKSAWKKFKKKKFIKSLAFMLCSYLNWTN